LAVAVLALTAVAVSSAQAAPAFHVGTAPATVTGEQTTRLELGSTSGVVVCSAVTFHGGTTVTASSTQEVLPTFNGCTTFGFLPTMVNPNGCGFLFLLIAGGITPFSATMDIVFPTGSAITLTSAVSNCEMTIQFQPALSGLTFSNTGIKTTRDLDASFGISGLTYSQTGSNCSGGEGTVSNGTMGGGVTLKADGSASTQQGLWIAKCPRRDHS
jgi:hypothetical protein